MGLQLSELTVFWKIITSVSRQLLSDSSVRIPFAGLENPAWAGWSHGGTEEIYGGGLKASTLARQIVKVRSPGLDLSHRHVW